VETRSASWWPRALTDDWRHGGFGVYVHWPFCLAKCPYCDFNSHVRREIDAERWQRALVGEVHSASAGLTGRRVDSIFFGGGTPSLMPPESVAAVIGAVASCWELSPEAEITLEANPTSVEAGRFRGYRDAGVNRISMGLQALDDGDLRRLGRTHTVAEAVAAFDVARAIFPRVSFDLIYARQDQTLDGWRSELGRALDLAADHLSLYQLTIEAGTRFGDLARHGRLKGLPEPDAAGDMYLETQEICAAAGLSAYEVSNHARRGAESRHNLVYWRYGDYAGIGPGAHGRLTRNGQRWATECERNPEDWLRRAEQSGTGVVRREVVSGAEQALEMLLMGLRLREGVDLGRCAALGGAPLDPSRVQELVGLGMVSVRNGRIAATDRGRAVLNAVIERLTENWPKSSATPPASGPGDFRGVRVL
jgi:putative oxygen-independent coproporphyrinogen III oxidase